MMALYLLSAAVFIGFITFVVRKYGIPPSVCESFYLLPPKWAHPLFAGFCLITAFPLMVFWLDITVGTTFQFLVFLACAPMLFVGAAAAFKGFSLTRRVHYASAALCAVSSQLWIVLNTHWWIASILLCVAAVLLSRRYPRVGSGGSRRTSRLFFVELAAFLSTYIAVMAYYINTI